MTNNLTLKQELERCERWLEDKTIEYNKVKKELEELKRYPTADEVCVALSDFFKNSKYHSYIDTVYYSENGKYFYTEDENRNLVEMIFDNYYIHEISPHLITLIGRFYEGLK